MHNTDRYRPERVRDLNQTIQRPWRMLDQPGLSFRVGIATPSQILFTLLQAKEARRHAESYRGYAMGACGYINRRGGSQIAINRGANFKNAPGVAEIDIHAEQMVLKSLIPGDKLTTLAIVGPPQADHDNGRLSPTRHPCAMCLTRLSDSEHVTPETLIICATPDGKEVERGDLAAFKEFHVTGRNNLGQASFEGVPSVFRQIPTRGGVVIVGNETELDTSDWDSQVTFPMAEWLGKRMLSIQG
jgi:cytidine deaminase